MADKYAFYEIEFHGPYVWDEKINDISLGIFLIT